MKSKYNTVVVDDLGEAFNKLFETFTVNVEERLERATRIEGNHAREYIKSYYSFQNKSNRSKYMSSFRTKKLNKLARELKNSEYRLSHLLEHGHKVANQYGSGYSINNSIYGTKGTRTKSFKMWEKTEEFVEEDYPKVIKKYLKNLL